MKFSFLLILILLTSLFAFPQKKKPSNDSVNTKTTLFPTGVTSKSIGKQSTTEIVITKKLDSIVSAYSNRPNVQATWTQIKAEAENLLFTYFRNGALMGTKPQDAYFVKMGTETMTSTDIASHKMKLQAGLAMIKPAEFKIITVEKINTSQ